MWALREHDEHMINVPCYYLEGKLSWDLLMALFYTGFHCKRKEFVLKWNSFVLHWISL